MSDDNASEQARKGLLDAAKGKAKEVVGAVTGNDSLTSEGQLQSAQARERKEAKATEMAAESQAAEAGEDLAAVKNSADQQRDATEATAEEIDVAREYREDISDAEAAREEAERARRNA